MSSLNGIFVVAFSHAVEITTSHRACATRGQVIEKKFETQKILTFRRHASTLRTMIWNVLVSAVKGLHLLKEKS